MNIQFSDVNYWLVTIFGIVVATFVALVRRLFTNETKIALLEQKLGSMNEDIIEMKDDIKSLLYKKY